MRSTRNLLIINIISMVLMTSMFVTSTFAWLSDSVSSGVNHIAAGHLAVEVTHTNAAVAEEKILTNEENMFPAKNGGEMLWEPGAVSYENITVRNTGSLALKYNLSINVENYNTVTLADGTKTDDSLLDVLKVMVLEGSEVLTVFDRANIMNLDWDDALSLSDFSKAGAKLYPVNVQDKESEESFQIIVYWKPGEKDADLNLDRGKYASDTDRSIDPEATGRLRIDFDVKLEAVQLDYEADSFDNTYDKGLGEDGENTGAGGNNTQTLPLTESYVGYYADVDGNNTIDGVIFFDYAKGAEACTDSSKSLIKTSGEHDAILPKTDNLKSYELVKIDNKDVVKALPGTSGDDRFYVIGLKDVVSSSNPSTKSLRWWAGSNTNRMNLKLGMTSNAFGSGLANTETLLNLYNKKATSKDGDDLWNLIESGWFVPSIDEWRVFGSEAYKMKQNGNLTSPLLNMALLVDEDYWSSSLEDTYFARSVSFVPNSKVDRTAFSHAVHARLFTTY